VAFAHVGDVSRTPSPKTDHHAALLLDAAHREPGSAPIAPLLAVDDRQQHFGLQLSRCGPGCPPGRACFAAICVAASALLRRAAAAHAEVRQRGARRPADSLNTSTALPRSNFGLFWKIRQATRSPATRLRRTHLALRLRRDTASLGRRARRC